MDYHVATTLFAQQNGIAEDLEKNLDYLAKYGCSEDPEYTKCVLGKDFSPHSYVFTMYRRSKPGAEYQPWFSGAMIFHPGGGQPDGTLAVTLDNLDGKAKPRWHIHT